MRERLVRQICASPILLLKCVVSGFGEHSVMCYLSSYHIMLQPSIVLIHNAAEFVYAAAGKPARWPCQLSEVCCAAVA